MVKKRNFSNSISKSISNSISNRVLYTLITICIFTIFSVAVYAYGTTNPSNFGHDAGELTGVCKTDGTGCPPSLGEVWGTSGSNAFFPGASELITNGNFATDISGWATSGGPVTWSSENGGTMALNGQAVAANADQQIVTVAGTGYTLSIRTYGDFDGSDSIEVQVGTSPGGTSMLNEFITSTGLKTFTFTASTATTHVRIHTGWSGLSVDDISVKRAGGSSTGNVGIGTTNPDSRLQVSGQLKVNPFGDAREVLIGTPGGTDGGITFRASASDSTTRYDLSRKGADLVFENSAERVRIRADGTIVANKITVTTVDPPYTIDGIGYATYGPSIAGGVKEEVSGSVDLSDKSYTIDFDNLPIGSDLWLFYQVTDFGSNMENLQVILTPGFNGRVWYKKDPVKNTLTIYSDSPGEVSYRLTANRHDWREWSNLLKDGSTGTILKSK